MPGSLANAAPLTGGRRRGVSVKTLKRALKKAGLKTTGRKAALTRRAKKAHLKMRGGVNGFSNETPANAPKAGEPCNAKDPSDPNDTNTVPGHIVDNECVPLPTKKGGRHSRKH